MVRLIKITVCTVVSVFAVGVLIIIGTFIYGMTISERLTPVGNFQRIVIDPPPTSLTNLVMKYSSGGMGDWRARFLFQLSPDDFNRIVATGFTTNLFWNRMDIESEGFEKRINSCSGTNVFSVPPPLIFQMESDGILKMLITDQNTNWVYYEARR
ncbi:MAG: hypothetical protein EOM44_14855 [Bacteroidia bacterium]|nr:hypothetical protein [Bacteroidia bacterium]NCC60858.1 hypothetical protein [Verrucomicrobiae bacterium]